MVFVYLLAVSVAAYLLGSVNFAVMISKAFTHEDVRNSGSGNAGTTNVLRTAGWAAGIITFLCDALKGAAGCLIGKLFFIYVYTGTA